MRTKAVTRGGVALLMPGENWGQEEEGKKAKNTGK